MTGTAAGTAARSSRSDRVVTPERPPAGPVCARPPPAGAESALLAAAAAAAVMAAVPGSLRAADALWPTEAAQRHSCEASGGPQQDWP